MIETIDDVTVLDLVAELLARLDRDDIIYCHWKSNEAITRSLTGDNDLDLLIAERDQPRFEAAVSDLGFEIATPSPDRRIPGLVDHFGLDEATGRMVHVQAHYQLYVGDDMTKNYRLGFEEAFLESRRPCGPIPVPSPEFELLVLIVRVAIKHLSWDTQVARKGRPTASERRELAYLEERADPGVLDELRERHLPVVSAELLAECRRAIAPGTGHLERARAGRQLLRALEPLARRPNRRDVWLRLWRRFRRRSQVGTPGSRRRIDTEGLMVAVVGGDGSGKSSTVAELDETFSRHFPTYTHHMGKPPRSFARRLLRRPLRWLPEINGQSRTSLPAWTDFETIGFPGHSFVLWHTLIARDRMREYRRARRRADGAGVVVISDRFPLPQITLMDNARTGALPGLERRPIARWLARREADYYTRIGSPDLLVVLRVDPDVAVARRPEQDSDFVRRRAEEVWAAEWGPETVVVDASRPREAVRTEVHSVVWAALGESART